MGEEMASHLSPAPNHKRWLQHVWAFVLDHRWNALLLVGLLAFVLGVTGFDHYIAAEFPGRERKLLDLVYLSLQLFFFESGAVFGENVHLDLQIARFLAPAVTLVSLYEAISKILGEQFGRARTWALRGHIVIAGLGEKGTLLARAYREQGRTVVAIERQADVDSLDRTRETGILVLVGDATSPAVQRRARVHAAATLIALAGDENTNAEIAHTAQSLSAGRPSRLGRLSGVVHIFDPHLWTDLHALNLTEHDRFHLEFLNLFHVGALEMLAEDAARSVAEPDAQDALPHIVVVGAGWFGQTLAMRAARLWRDRPHADARRMRITLLDRVATARRDELFFRYPEIASVADIETLDLEVPPASPEQSRQLSEHPMQPTAFYVSLDDDTRGLHAGLALRKAFPAPSIPITVRTRRELGIARLARPEQASPTRHQGIHIFPLYDRTCQPILAQRTALNGVLAQLLHAEWLLSAEPSNPNRLPWDKLSPVVQEWNRSQATHIPTKLEMIGCSAVPTPEWDVPLYVIPEGDSARITTLEAEIEALTQQIEERKRRDDPESWQQSPVSIEELHANRERLRAELDSLATVANPVDWLAKTEHERWLNERADDTWTVGSRDDAAKKHPDMVPWKQLTRSSRDKNRRSVRGIPSFLAKAGYRVEAI